MNIVIVGCGKVGYTIAKNLSLEEDNHITIIDKKLEYFDKIQENIDVMTVKGNGLSGKTLNEVDIKNVDLIICVTNSDETNILCCLTAKRLGAKHTIARIRDPEYAKELSELKKDLGINMIINPEQQAAFEMSRLIRFPSADDIDTFVHGRIELISFRILNNPFFLNKTISQVFYKSKHQVLAAAIERDGEVFIPHGETEIKEGDILRILGKPSAITDFIRFAGESTSKIKNVTIIGGGKITHYVSEFLIRHNIKIKIIEINKEKCDVLSETLPKCLVIHGDGTDEEVLRSENIEETDALICLTDMDEENVVMALYAKQLGIPKIIIKINHININLVKNLGIGSIVCPKDLTAEQIITFVLGLKNSLANGSIMTVQKIISSKNSQIEALEFNINSPSKIIDIPLKDLHIKKGVLIASIIRKGIIIIPTGISTIKDGDDVVVITEKKNIFKFEDILIPNNFFGVEK